ncbi:MAG: type II toxin-antitoxin system CcdA family antitoxin [Actinomycetota bacterium]|nr:type II toxin-antitoxin system CcdA family antitoxin [Actinomycetota bacterium]
MTVKVGISLPDATHARALEQARSAGTTLSGLVDAALRAELTRRELADHVAMLAEADDADRLRKRARSRGRALSVWKTGP